MVDDLFPYETRRSLPIALLRARETIMQNFRPMLAAHNLNEQQWRVMRILSELGKISTTELASRAFVLPPSLSRILKNLEQRLLIERLEDENDRRRMLVSLTKEGKLIIVDVIKDSKQVYAKIETSFGRERTEALLKLLDECVAMKV